MKDISNNYKIFSVRTIGVSLLLIVVLAILSFKIFFVATVFPKDVQIKTIVTIGIVLCMSLVWKKLVPDLKDRERQQNKVLNIWAIFLVSIIGLQIILLAAMFVLIFLGVIK